MTHTLTPDHSVLLPVLRLTLRTASASELPTLAALAELAERSVHAAHDHPELVQPRMSAEHLVRLVADHDLVWGAWAENPDDLDRLHCADVPCPMGMLVLGGPSSTSPGRIHHVAVARRGLGVGGELLALAERSARELGLEQLSMSLPECNELTLDFLLQHGFSLAPSETGEMLLHRSLLVG